MSYLTREQLDKYVKDLASKTPKTTSLNTQSKGSPLVKVPPTSPLSSSTTNSSSISTGERKIGSLYGPRSPPPNRNSFTTASPRTSIFSNDTNKEDNEPSPPNRNSLPATISSRASVFNNNDNNNKEDSESLPPNRNSLPVTISPKVSVFSNNNKEDNDNSSLDEIRTTPIIVHDSISNNSSTKSSNTSNSNEDDEKKPNYKSIDEIVNDLSYPMETKLSFKPTTSPPQSKGNNSVSPPKEANDSTKGSYVLSAAFRSSYSAASRTPSVKRPVIQPSPKQEQREITSNKNQRDSTIQELQNRSDTNWSARYDEAQQKYPPLNKLDKDKEIPSPPSSPLQKQNKNNVGSPPQNSNPLATSNSRQTTRPISISSSLDCASCGKSISGNILSAMGKKWHPDHFVCKKCGITLEHVAFFEKDGDPYCHLDFHELFSPRCGHCETPIEGQVINALGKSWHPGHFFCRECGNPFEGGFRVHEGFPYCEKDWLKLFAPRCKGCKEVIKGGFMTALEGMWHRECFVCMTCKEPFDSSYHYVFEGKPYCDKHYRDLLAIN